MWRGLILNRAVQHFLQDVDWGDDLDYLLIDMPPGTGDVQMGVAKLVPRTEVLVVTTPALAAQKVAARAVSMARKNFLRVAGVIENMSAFVVRPRRVATPLFGAGGGEALAAEAGVPAARPGAARAGGRRRRRHRRAGRARRRTGRRGVPGHRRAHRHRGHPAGRAAPGAAPASLAAAEAALAELRRPATTPSQPATTPSRSRSNCWTRTVSRRR